MTKAVLNSLSVRPIIHFPKEAEAGRTYLLTIDLAPQQALDTWPYPDDEELTIYCLPNAEPLFRCEPLGEPAVVIHRFGGTYGPARFLITAAAAPREGVIRVTLVNGLGVPMTAIETSPIRLLEKVERKQEADVRVRREPAEVERSREAVTPSAEPVEPIVPAEPDEPEYVRPVQRVYLSSTYTDLREYREAVYRALRAMRVDVLAMEDYFASDARPLERVLKDVAECDVFISIIAWRYGFVPTEDNPEGLSITELEYRHARSLGKPCLIYLLDEEAPWPRRQIEEGEPAEKVQRLRVELRHNHLVTTFGNADELAAHVSADIAQFKYKAEVERESAELPALLPEAISISRLPVTGAQLFGREEELRQLDVELINRDAHILTVVGWGGIGKSALVNHWLARIARDNYRGPECVYGWSFHGEDTADRNVTPDNFIDSALRFFGDPDHLSGSLWDKGERLARLVGRRRALLILDGLEKLQHPPGPDEGSLQEPSMQALLRGLATYNQGLCVITTRVRVADLTDFENSTVNRLTLESLSPEAGAQVLAAHGARGTEAELEQASREYDGHPLSLSLLGSYLNDVFGGDIGRRGEVRGLEEDERYGRTARELLTSYERWLGEGPEIAVLRVLSLSAGGMDQTTFDAVRTAPAIQGLTEALQSLNERRWQQVLSRLRRAGLLTAQPATQSGLLKTHPLVRDHFSSQLADLRPEAWREGNNRLYEHYKRVAKEFPDTLEEMAPLYAAVNHGCAAGKYQEVLDEVYHRRILRGDQLYNQKQLKAYNQDLAVLSNFFGHPWSQVVSGLGDSSRSLVLTLAGHSLRALGRLTESTQPMQVNLSNALSRERWVDAVLVACNLCETYLLIGDLALALKVAQQGVDIASQIGDIFQQSAARAIFASTLHQMGRITEAEQIFREAEAMHGALDSQRSLLHSLQGFYFCELLLDQGNHQEVRTRTAQTIDWAMQQGWRSGVLLGSLFMGRALLLQALQESTSDFLQATEYLEQAVDGLRQAGTLEYLPLALLSRAELNRVKGEFNQAQADVVEALSVATHGGMGLHRADCELGYTRLYLARGEVEHARARWERAKELIEQIGYHRRAKDLEEIGRLLDIDKSTSGHFYEFGHFRLYPDERRLVHDGKTVRLASRELSLLHLLVGNSQRLLTRAEIMNAVWPKEDVDENNVHRVVANLRKVLGDISKGQQFIEVVRRGGYRFVATVNEHGIRSRQAASDSDNINTETESKLDAVIPKDIADRLRSGEPSERAAAISELSHIDTDEAFQQICAAFDDPAKEVRSAAARTLYDLRADRAESFTRALREATPDRRREIGAAISYSGLAAESISQLTGESREKTYEAFSLLYLMAKAGEVQPLLRAIEGHPNNEVRLAVIKLLALSGQKEILPAFRRLAVRGSLPTEVRSAVMEAIYQISSSQPSTEAVVETAPAPENEGKESRQTPPITDRTPSSLVLLIDREAQESVLSSAYHHHMATMSHRPFLCIIHGRESEAPELYVNRLVRYSLPPLLNITSPLRRIYLRLSLEQNPTHTYTLILRELTLAFKQIEPASLPLLAEAMARSGTPILLDWNMDMMIPKADKERRLGDFLQFWDEWSDFRGAVVVICLSLRYPDPKTSIYKRSAIKSIEEEMRALITQLNFDNYKNIGGVILPELLPVRRADVLEFVRRYVVNIEDRRRINLEFSNLSKRKSSIPMGQLSPRIQQLLESIVARPS